MYLQRPVGLERAKGVDKQALSLLDIAIDGCEALSDAGCTFIVEGFGTGRWPVDVWYDLSTIVGQLPDACFAVQNGVPAEIDFFGQGLERSIQIEPVGKSIELHCDSRIEWQPDPSTIILPAEDFERMLIDLAKDFANALEIVRPGLASSDPMPAWRRGELSSS